MKMATAVDLRGNHWRNWTGSLLNLNDIDSSIEPIEPEEGHMLVSDDDRLKSSWTTLKRDKLKQALHLDSCETFIQLSDFKNNNDPPSPSGIRNFISSVVENDRNRNVRLLIVSDVQQQQSFSTYYDSNCYTSNDGTASHVHSKNTSSFTVYTVEVRQRRHCKSESDLTTTSLSRYDRNVPGMKTIAKLETTMETLVVESSDQPIDWSSSTNSSDNILTSDLSSEDTEAGRCMETVVYEDTGENYESSSDEEKEEANQVCVDEVLHEPNENYPVYENEIACNNEQESRSESQTSYTLEESNVERNLTTTTAAATEPEGAIESIHILPAPLNVPGTGVTVAELHFDTETAKGEENIVIKVTAEENDAESMEEQTTQRSALKLRRRQIKKNVSFADEMGRSLTEVKLFMSEKTEPKHSRKGLSSPNFGKNRNDWSYPGQDDGELLQAIKWKLQFPQPRIDSYDVRQRLERQNVILADIELDNPPANTGLQFPKISGTIKVKSLAFEKSVWIRLTTNHWRTYTDFAANYNPSLSSIYSGDGSRTDGFNFEIDTQTACSSEKALGLTIEFAIRYLSGPPATGKEFWDSYSGRNYALTYELCGATSNTRRQVINRSHNDFFVSRRRMPGLPPVSSDKFGSLGDIGSGSRDFLSSLPYMPHMPAYRSWDGSSNTAHSVFY